MPSLFKKISEEMLELLLRVNLRGRWRISSWKERKDSYNENYYIQTAAYAEMFEELTGKPINQIVILVVTENGTVQEFIKDKQEYIPLLEETIEEWYQSWM